MILLPGGSPPLIRKLIIFMLMIDFHHADVQVLVLVPRVDDYVAQFLDNLHYLGGPSDCFETYLSHDMETRKMPKTNIWSQLVIECISYIRK